MQEAAEHRIDGRGVVIPNPVDLPPPGVCNPAWFHDEFPATRDGEVILVLVADRPRRRDDPARESIPLWLVRHAVGLMIRLILRIDIRGLEHLPTTGPVLLAGNHTGFLDGPQKWSAMAAASVFVLPSYSENFGIAVVEAMAAGTPVVISDAVGIHREVAESRAGFVVPCAVEPLAEALKRVLAQPERLGQVAQTFRGDTFLPAIGDLEEGLSMKALTQKYGEPGGDPFRAACRAVRQRIDDQPIYKNWSEQKSGTKK